MKTPSISATTASGIVASAYGTLLRDPADFRDPFAFDDYELWFGNDFDFLIDSIFDDIFKDIEDNIETVDSSNESEAASRQESLEQEEAGVASMSNSNATSMSDSDGELGESPSETLDHAHSAGSHGKHGPVTTESSFSGTLSMSGNNSGTAESNSEGTSGTSLSTVTFTLKEYENFFANNNDD